MINTYSEKFIPIFIRVSIILTFIPFIGAKMTPMMARAGIALAFTLLLIPVVNVKMDNPVKAVFEAIFIGMAIGLSARIILGAIEMASQWISLQMGLGVAAIFNPQFGEILSPISLFYTFLSMGLFFLLDMHHYFIEGIVRSFDVHQLHYNTIYASVMKLNSFLFPIALKIAAPIFLVQILVNLGMGFLSRAIPQANMFFVSMPLLIFIGIVFMMLSLPLVFMIITKSFLHTKDAIMLFTK